MSDINKLKAVTLFRDLSEEMVRSFAEYFKPTAYAAGDVVFKEKTQGDTMFIIAEGEITIEKALDEEGAEFKPLAILATGDFFGEMAVIEGQMRFAQARASKDSALYQIDRVKLFSFIKEHPDTGITVFTAIMKTLLKRLQHTSNELTMLFDLSRQLTKEHKSPGDFLAAVMSEMKPYLEGKWNIRAYSWNLFNDEYDQVFCREDFPQTGCEAVAPASPQNGWQSDSSYTMVSNAEGRKLACAVFTKPAPATALEKNNLATIFNTISSIIGTAMVNIEHQAEAAMQAKLKQAKY